MVLVSVFLMNMLCALVPCDPVNQYPEIDRPLGERGFLRGKRLIGGGDDGPGGGESYPIVRTGNGLVQGYPMMVMSGRRISAFEGIKYADTPTRFTESSGVGNWSGIIRAFRPGPCCLQTHPAKMFRVVGSEKDCLTLNIYTPKIPPKEGNTSPNNSSLLLPVIIFIHGGSFSFGAGAEFGPSYLLEKNVVLVTINYRVGVLGFMSTGDDHSPGNYGLKDQQVALKWIHKNIEAFSGNPHQITLMGQSAGAVSAHLHSLNSESRKYFGRVVLLSGSGFNHWGIQSPKTALRWTHSLAKQVKCPTRTTLQIVNCFRKMDPNWLVAAQINIFDWMPFPPVLFAPVVEHWSSVNPFIRMTPEDILNNGTLVARLGSPIPAIFSMTSQEGFMTNYVLNGLMKVGHFINNVVKYLPYYLDYYQVTGEDDPRGQALQRNITKRILDFYLGNETNPRNVPLNAYGDMGTDRMFGVGIHKAIEYHSRTAPTYASLFSYLGKYNQAQLVGMPENEIGVAHTEDLFYLFNSSLYLQGFMQSDPEAQLSKIIVNLITNFATKSEPLYTDPKSGKDVQIWDAVTPEDQEEGEAGEGVGFLQLDRDVKMIKDPFVQRRRFWESLGLRDMRPMSGQIGGRYYNVTPHHDINLNTI